MRTQGARSRRGGVVAFVCAGALALSGCGPRGALTFAPEAAGVGSVEPLYVATVRGDGGGPNVWSALRADALAFARFDVSIPPERALGTVTFPKTAPPNPATDFVTVGAKRIRTEAGFVAAVDRSLAALPPAEREVVVFTHGFNTNFSEGLYRQAQMTHDFGTEGVSVHFAWPSAASVRSYGLDRESAIFARDGLQETLEALARTKAERIVVAAHSMGAMVLMEALRTMAIAGDARFFAKLQAVVLMAPDLDVEVFRAQMRPLRDLKVPIYVFYSGRDRALWASSFLRGQDERLGSIRDVAELEGYDITFIDTSAATDGVDALGHFAVATSPAMISMISGLDRIGGRVLADAQYDPNVFERTVNVVQGVGEAVLEPLAQ